MNWKLEDILGLSLEKIFEAAPHAELISVKMYYSTSYLCKQEVEAWK